MELIGRIPVYSSNEIEQNIVSIGFECLDRDMFNPEKCYNSLEKTGVKFARCQTGWAKCEKEKGKYDFEWLDKIVNKLISIGITPWFNVGYGNPLYMNDLPNTTGIGCVPLLYGEVATEAWKNYLSALTKHFKGRVNEYEIWNEANITHFWYPSVPNGKEYAKLISVSGKIIHSEYKAAKIGACISGCASYPYISDMLSGLSPDELDFFCYHCYKRIPEDDIPYVRELRKLFDTCGFDETEIWDGEGGFPSWAYEGHFCTPSGITGERAQAVWQLRHFFLDVYSGAKRISFFQMADMWEKPYEKAKEVLSKPAAHGILNGITYTPKKSYYTIQTIASLFAGGIEKSDNFFSGNVSPEDATLQNACVKMAFTKKGFPMYVYYIPTSVIEQSPKGKTFSATLSDPLKNPVLIDTYNRNIYSVEETPANKIYPCSYANLPITEYPMILTEKDIVI